MKLAYLDCFSGISGDMALGALVDLGVPVDWLSDQIRKMPLSGFSLRSEAVSRSHIAATRVHVEVEDRGASRTWADIRQLIEAADLPVAVRNRSLAVFGRLAEVEAGIHGCPVDEVHFHEVGGTDAIVDVVGTAFGLAHLGIDRMVCSPLPMGTGFVQARHGRIPVPAPATVALLKGIPVYGSGSEAELVTPTGAALASVLADGFGPLPAMCIERAGYGAGSADLPDRPNLLRVLIGPARSHTSSSAADSVAVMDAAIDDMNPELFGFLMERLFAEGALDVCWMPAQMKKNRPGTRVEVICRPEDAERLTETLLAESSSTGVRCQLAARRVLPRKTVSVETEFGTVAAKEIRMPDGSRRLTPEYDACRRIALLRGVAIWRVYEAAVVAGRQSAGRLPGDPDPESV